MDEDKKEPTKSEIKKIEKFLENIDNSEPKIRKKPKMLSPKQKERLGKSIGNAMSEYMDCYIMMGFDTNGNSVVLVNSSSNLEIRALTDLLHDFLSMDFQRNGPKPPIEPPSDFDEF